MAIRDSARSAVATRLIFFVAGLVVAARAPLVPYLKEGGNYDDRGLGLLLLLIGLGSIVSMPLASYAAARLGCRKPILLSAVLIVVSFPAMLLSSDLAVVGSALFLFGAGVGAIDCVMNVQAVLVEKGAGRSMMPGFHGLYSVGGLAGATVMTAILSVGSSAETSSLIVAALVCLLVVLSARGLLTYSLPSQGGLSLPNASVIQLAAICFVMFLADGAILNWSAVLAQDVEGFTAANSGMAYASFAGAMMIGRLSGNRVVDMFGARNVLLVGGIVNAVFLSIAAFSDSWLWTLLAYAVTGLASANIVPIAFTAAGGQTRMPPSMAVALITICGYAGVLVGPPVVGIIAGAINLRIAFLLLSAVIFLVTFSGAVAKHGRDVIR